jgi:hypothetical protein
MILTGTASNLESRKGGTMEDMTRLELLTLLYSLQALLEDDKAEKAKEVIDKIIKEAETTAKN